MNAQCITVGAGRMQLVVVMLPSPLHDVVCIRLVTRSHTLTHTHTQEAEQALSATHFVSTAARMMLFGAGTAQRLTPRQLAESLGVVSYLRSALG